MSPEAICFFVGMIIGGGLILAGAALGSYIRGKA